MTNNEKAGLFTANMPLHSDFVELLTECVEDSKKLERASNRLDAINTRIDEQISHVTAQQKQILGNQVQIVKTLIAGLSLPKDDPTYTFAKGYVDSLGKKETPKEEGD